MKKLGGIILYDVEDIADFLGVHRASVQTFFREGRLSGRKLGRRWYTTEEELRRAFREPEPLGPPEDVRRRRRERTHRERIQAEEDERKRTADRECG